MNTPDKVLVVIESGVPSRYWEAAVPLVRDVGFDPVLVTLRGRGPLHEAVEARGVRTAALGAVDSRDYPGTAVRLARLIRRERADLIHAAESIPAAIAGFAGVLARRGVRVFHRQHEVPEGNTARLGRLASRFAHLTMAVSRSTAEFAMTTERLPPARVRVACNGVADLRPVGPEEARGARASLGIPDGTPVIVIVARLRPVKGHQTLLDALPRIADGLGRAPHLVIVGTGPEESALQERVRALGTDAVHFAGHTEDVAPWFAAADVVAMPSYVEPFGLSAIEALAGGRPLVASGVGGLREVVEDGVSGLLVPPRDPAALADGLLRVLRSPRLARDLAEGGRRRFLERFTVDAMVRGWAACYDEALRMNWNPPRVAVACHGRG